MTHELKTWPLFYAALLAGVKTFEVRKNDRDFQIGDTLLLREWSSTEGYSGRQMLRQVTYMFMNSPWLLSGYVVMGLTSAKHSEACSIHAFPNTPIACDCLQAQQPAEARTERGDWPAKLQLTEQLRDIATARESRTAHIYKIAWEAANALEACHAANDDLLKNKAADYRKGHAAGFAAAREAAEKIAQRPVQNQATIAARIRALQPAKG